jgi:acetyl esterase
MPLTPEAAAVIDIAQRRMPVEMNQIPIADLRAGTVIAESTTPIHQTSDVMVPASFGDIPVRIYQPNEKTDLPVLMWMHGGGFAIGDLAISDDILRRISNAASITVVSVDYRLAPENPYPAGLLDTVAVWEWLQSGPVDVASDTTRLAVGGDSAGGNLALGLALRTRDENRRQPEALVAAYATAQMRVCNPELATPPILSAADCTWFWDMYATPEQRREPYCCPAQTPTVVGHCPSLIITAEYDATRDGTEDYANRMIAAGVDATLTRYDGVMHGFLAMASVLPEAVTAIDEIATFLKEKL